MARKITGTVLMIQFLKEMVSRRTVPVILNRLDKLNDGIAI